MIAQRRQAEGIIMFPIFFVSHPNERHFQKPDNCCKHLIFREPWTPEITFHTGANFRQDLCEIGHSIEFRRVPDRAPSWMVPILLAIAGIASNGLNVPLFQRTDPDISPGRGNGERSNSCEGRWI